MANEPVYRPSVRPGGTDPTTRRLATVAGAIGLALAVVIGGWSLLAHNPRGVPVIGPPPGPLKVRPTNAGGLQVLGAEPPAVSEGGTETLGPPPEQADPARLAAELARAHDAASPPPAPKPAAAPATPPQAAPTAPAAKSAPHEETAAGPARSPTGPTPPERAPSVLPLAVAPAGAPSEVAGAAGRTLPTPAAPSVAPPAPVPAASTAEAGRITVQLAALDSDAAAHAEWRRLAARSPTLFGDRAPSISSVERDGHTWFRVRTGPFATVASATEFCARAHAAKLACDVATF